MAYRIEFPESIAALTPTAIHRMTYYRPASHYMGVYLRSGDLEEALSVATLAVIEKWEKINAVPDYVLNRPLHLMRRASGYIAHALKSDLNKRGRLVTNCKGTSDLEGHSDLDLPFLQKIVAPVPMTDDPFEEYCRPNEVEFMRESSYTTLEESAKRFGVSFQRVSQRRREIIERLRARHNPLVKQAM